MDGEINDVWVRATVCFRKIDGHWKVTHEHMSVPYDMETSKASVDLKP
jgi:ketosteroid isomerase-like protein